MPLEGITISVWTRTLGNLTPEEFRIMGGDDGSKASSESCLGGIAFHIEDHWVVGIHIVLVLLWVLEREC
jgi:hypothetical protein